MQRNPIVASTIQFLLLWFASATKFRPFTEEFTYTFRQL